MNIPKGTKAAVRAGPPMHEPSRVHVTATETGAA